MDFYFLRRKTCYVGIPRNIERHAYLWEVTRNEEWILSDPAPPYNGQMMYTRRRNTPDSLPDSFFSGLVHSIWPNYDQVNVGLMNSYRNSKDDIAQR
ncbi:unnamed protein product [Onchocerca flexuosa]|uniref:Pecanex-like protein n=1 Tax=Onchocerca flexuosa TaxID=387005 RepID=A0A183HFT7_9BILA|nr:unnamed protein product [Onchocerca flexuosa]